MKTNSTTDLGRVPHAMKGAGISAQQKLEELASLVGKTPMLAIHFIYRGSRRTVYANFEQMNLTGSIKDRVATEILREAYAVGKLKQGDYIVEATSGNMGISIAAVGAVMGHSVRIYMPDWMSQERVKLIASYGADIVLISHEDGGFSAPFAALNN